MRYVCLCWLFADYSTHQDPYEDVPESAIRAGVLEGRRLPIPETAPPQVAELIAECWHQDPAKRPKMPAVVERLAKLQKPVKFVLQQGEISQRLGIGDVLAGCGSHGGGRGNHGLPQATGRQACASGCCCQPSAAARESVMMINDELALIQCVSVQ